MAAVQFDSIYNALRSNMELTNIHENNLIPIYKWLIFFPVYQC